MTPEWESALEEAFDLDLTQLVQIDSALVRSSGIEQDLIRLDKDMNHYQFKCGVLYVKDGQYKEDEWFSNNHGSTSFDSFLDCLGEKISLKGYQGWAAGLDTKSGDSGDYTYTSTWQDIYQVTYHISTLIPSTSGDKQHIQKKRHIGNDIVCIVFVDGNKPFDPAAIKSQFLHVFIIVHQEELHGRIGWRVEVTCVKDVPLFGPAVTNQTFYDKPSLHNFLLAKLINAEYAALKAPKFTKPLDRARKGILSNVVERILKMQQNSSNKSGGVKVHNNNSKSSSNNNISKYHVTSLRPSSATAEQTMDLNSTISSLSSPSSTSSSSFSSPSLLSPTMEMDYLYDQDQYPSPQTFGTIVQDYLQNLSSKKRDKALVDQNRYGLILQVLKDPRNTAISTAQFRFWVKKMFQLNEPTTSGSSWAVYHDNKPVAMQEQIYPILIQAHREAQHGGRDKTSALVRKRYSWIPKELIARFVRRCPFCISRRNGHISRPTRSHQTTQQPTRPNKGAHSAHQSTLKSNSLTNRPHPYEPNWKSGSPSSIATSAAASAVSTQWIEPGSTPFYYYSPSSRDSRQQDIHALPDYAALGYMDQRQQQQQQDYNYPPYSQLLPDESYQGSSSLSALYGMPPTISMEILSHQ
ncbi:hypothetical protein BC941DRAFT_347507 [Chlamydoabsidia padenii]|nr:hypothetical protein BC941DRAFT_347507 [Chlamydoabsidia padenii]